MRVVARLLVSSCIVAGLAGQALGQGGVNGSIIGSVFDQTGLPLKGVKLSARSDTQIGGAKVAYTNDEGSFRLVGLQPGTFEVHASAPKLKTVVQKDLKVGINAPAEVTLIMEVETAVEEVKVVERAPIVSTTTANVKQVYDEEFLDSLPLEFKTAAEAFVSLNTPGVVAQGDREFRVHGGGTGQNAVNVEGFFMNNQKVTMKAMQAVEVQTAGFGAENASVPGGVVNMVSKSGSNKFELDLSGFAEDSGLRFFQDASDIEAPSHRYVLNPALSGPIIKDRLWYYLNTELRSEVSAREKDLSGANILGDPATRWSLRGRASLKLTWQATPRNKISTYSMLSRDATRNPQDPNVFERDAQEKWERLDFFHGVIWESLLTDNVLFRSQVGYNQFWEERAPDRCRTEPVDCDHIPQVVNTFPRTVRLQNFQRHLQEVTRSIEILNQLEWFASSKTLGEHNIKLKSRFFNQLQEQAESTPGDAVIQFNGTTPDRKTEYFANDPRLEPARYGWSVRGTSGLTTVHSLQDSVRLTRYLTFSPGVALTTASAGNAGQANQLENAAVTPHFAVAWDATHDGRTALRASFNNYVDTDVVRMSKLVLGRRVSLECRWNEATQAYDSQCRYAGGSSSLTFGQPCGPNGVDAEGSSCKESLRMPRVWEYTTGVEREIIEGVGLGTDVVYRLYSAPYELRETNRIWLPSGYDLDPAGGYRNGRNETVSDLGTPSVARRRYLGVTTSMRKREGAFKLLASYTWSRLQGNVNNNEDNDLGTNPAKDLYYLYGDLADDSRHAIKAAMSYQVTKWLSAGFVYRYFSGRPYSRRFRNDVTGSTDDYRASIGINPGSNVNDPGDDRPLRLPDLQEVNLQLRGNFKPLLGHNLEGFVDVINILALRTTTSVVQQDGPTFAQPLDRKGPMMMRLGFRYRY